MKIKWIVIAVGIAVVITAALSLRTDRKVTTSSDQAYNYYLAGIENANRLYNNEALENFEAAVQLDDNFASAWAYLSKYYCIMGRKEECKIAANRAYELAKNLPERERLSIYILTAEVRGDLSDFEENLEFMLQRYPNEIEPRFTKASLLWKRGKLPEAIEEFQLVLKINPNYALAYNSLGYLYAQLGDFTKAIEYLKKYVFIAPDQANPHDSLGEIYLMIGRYGDAIDLFKRALAVKPGLAVEPNSLGSTIQLHLAQALARKGRLEEARQSLDRALKLSTGQWMNQYVMLEKIRMATAQKQYTEALNLIAEVQESESYDYELGPSLAAAYEKLGRPDKIAQLIEDNDAWLLKTVRKSVGDSIDITDKVLSEQIEKCQKCSRIHNRGRWLELFSSRAAGKYDETLAHATSLLEDEVYSHSKMVLQYQIAKTYFDQSEYREALAALKPVLKINTNFHHFVLLTARAQMKAGDFPAAENTLKNFISFTHDADTNWSPRQEALALLAELDPDAIQ